MTGRKLLDVGLYLILGPNEFEDGGLAMIEDALVGGVTLIQYRDKHSTTRRMVEILRTIKARMAETSPQTPLIVNDRADVMLAAGADGLHVGRDDLPAVEARQIIGPDAILGVTVKNEEEARAVDPKITDYASIGGVFQTTSKVNPDPPIGLEGLGKLSAIITDRAPSMPISAIAGIDRTNAKDVVAAGADGIALIRAITQSDNPRKAAAELRALVQAGREERETRRDRAI